MSSLQKRIGIGIIGIQGFGRTYLNTLKAQLDVDVIALCDLNLEAASKLAEQYSIPVVVSDYKELLSMENIDAVFVATPHFLHHAMTIDALKAGKHVFCEKPLAVTTEDAWDMAKTARELGLILTCHYNRRQTLPVKMFKDLVEKGTFGTIYQINLKWMARYTSFMFDTMSSWRVSKEKAGGGILIGRGSHMIDAIWYILGKPEIKSVYASVSSKLTSFEVDDYTMVVIKLKNGITIHVECSYECNIPNYKEKMEYEIFGTKAGAVYSQVDNVENLSIGYNKFPANEWVDLTDTFDMENYKNMLPNTIVEDFLEAIRQGKDPNVTGEDAAFITELLQAVYKSSDSGTVVTF